MRTSYQNIPEPHTRTSKRISEDRRFRRTFYSYRGSSKKVFIQELPFWTSQKIFHTRTNAEHLPDLLGDLLGMLLKELYEIMQGPLIEDFTRISTVASHKELCKKLTKISMPGPLRESHNSVIKRPPAGEDLTRSWYKKLRRASQSSFRRSSSYT